MGLNIGKQPKRQLIKKDICCGNKTEFEPGAKKIAGLLVKIMYLRRKSIYRFLLVSFDKNDTTKNAQ